jgi:hypothetical protein
VEESGHVELRVDLMPPDWIVLIVDEYIFARHVGTVVDQWVQGFIEPLQGIQIAWLPR